MRSAYGKAASLVGIGCNVLLFAGKLFAGLLSGSVAIMADAVNNLSDVSSSLISLLGFKLADRPADAEHPYGHGRFEYLSGMTVAVMILAIGVELLKSSVGKIFAPEPVDVQLGERRRAGRVDTGEAAGWPRLTRIWGGASAQPRWRPRPATAATM